MDQPDNFTLQATLEQAAARREEAKASSTSEFFAALGRVAIVLALMAAPWMYGSVLSWSQYYLSIAVLVGLGFWWFETALNRKDRQVFPYIFFPMLAGVFVGLVQLIPLPEWLEFLAGRQTEIYERYSLESSEMSTAEGVRSYLTLDRAATWGQLRTLALAIAGLLLGCRLFRSRRDMILLTAALSINGAAIAFFGFIQKLAAPPRTVYWMELTQGGTPFGPFVNRNNAAGYLLLCLAAAIGLVLILVGDRKDKGPLPMVSKEMPPWRQLYYHFLFFVSELTATKIASLLLAVLITCGVVGTLSRGGFLALAIAGIVTLLIYGMARRPKHTGFIILPLVGLVVALTSWLGFGEQLMSRFENTEVELEEVVDADARMKHWRDTLPATYQMGVLGSGLGTYAKVHRLYRTDHESKVFEYAENQYFQAAVEAGYVGLLFFLAAWVACWLYASKLINKGQSSTSVGIGTLGIFLIVSQATAAFFDFGMYIPSNMLTMAVLVGLVAYHSHSLASRLRKRSWLQFQFPNLFVQAVLLVVFAGVTLAVFDFNRQTKIDEFARENVARFGPDRLSLEETDQRIEALQGVAGLTVSADGLKQLGDLWVHRCRLELLSRLQQLPAYEQLVDQDKEQFLKSLWGRTRLSQMHEIISSLKRESELLAARFVSQEFIPYNLGQAIRYYTMSRMISPLQPRVHMQIGRINAIYGRDDAARQDLTRAIELAPGNAEIRVAAGILWLQQGDAVRACEQFRIALTLKPKDFVRTMNTVLGLTTRSIEPVSKTLIFEKVLPDDSSMLYQFASRYLENDEKLRLVVLEKADSLLGEVSRANKKQLLLSANIKFGLGNTEDGVQLLNDILTSYPGNDDVRARLVSTLLDEGELDDAAEHLDRLLRSNQRNKKYNALAERYRKLKQEELDKQK